MKWLKSILCRVKRIFFLICGKIMIETFIDADDKKSDIDSDEIYLIRADAYNIGIVFNDGSFRSFPIDKAGNWDNYQKISRVIHDPFSNNSLSANKLKK